MIASGQAEWNGKIYPYIPSTPLNIHSSVKVHENIQEDVDPITFEVVRYAMWNINVEQGNTLVRVSGSPIAAYGHDFNPCLLDEKGDFVFFGPFLQYLSSASSSAVKWTLENRSSNPGISDGDIFLTNDPWIGATHQADVCVYAPMFWEGELFCWFANALHQWDLGGTTPGSFNPISQDVFWESGCIPPIKMVEKGVIRKDLEDEYLRRSRVPDLVGLDLRAQITACNVARERMKQLLQKYGSSVVKNVMKKLQDNSEIAFLKRLETIPDGRWTEQAWIEQSREGDRSVYRNVLSLTKKGNKLIFDNHGTDDQVGSINCTAIAWKGAIASMISAQMLFDQMFVIEGAYRHINFNPEPGTITCAKYPAGVVSAPPVVLLQTIGLAGLVISRMLMCSSDAALRSEVQSCMGALMFPIDGISGVDQRGNPYTSFLLDPVGGALGALSWKDGVNTGGWPWDLQSTMPNVEDNEIFNPLIYLWRKEVPDSGGAGKFRGGNSAELAYVLNDTESMIHTTTGGHTVIPGPGLFGGDPTSRTRYLLVKDANVREVAGQNRKMPSCLQDLEGEHINIAPKAGNILQKPGDVFSMAWTSAGGYGDPLERDPEMVLKDVQNCYISKECAVEKYGVFFNSDQNIDREGTDALRKRIRKERIAVSTVQKKGKIPPDEREIVINEHLVLHGSKGHQQYVCRECRTEIMDASANYKTGCVMRTTNIKNVGLAPLDPKLFIDDEIIYKEYFCPGCGIIFQSDFSRKEDDHLWDIHIS